MSSPQGNSKDACTCSPVTPVNNAGKEDDSFRMYDTATQRVLDHYRDMRTHQTVAFYRRMEQKYSFEHGRYRRLMTVAEAFDELEHYVVRTIRT